MTVTVIPSLDTILDNLAVTGGGLSLTFDYVPWGRHYDRNSYAAGRGLIVARQLGNPTRNGDVGSGVANNEEQVEIQAMWEDSSSLTDPEAFRQEVVKAIVSAIRGVEKTLGGSYYAYVRNTHSADELLGLAVKFGVVLLLEARAQEVYA